MRTVLYSICYCVIGATLASAKVYVSDWRYWVIILAVSVIQIIEFVDGMKR